MDFKVKEDGLIYFGDVEDPQAYINYVVEDGKMSITHTVVKKELGGQGVAGKLTEKAIEIAREKGYKIIPVCSYAVRYFDKNEELRDLLA